MGRYRFSLRVLLLVALSCWAGSASGAAAEGPREVAPSELAARVSAPGGPLLLDVRTADEFAEGHIPGALLIPLSELKGRLHQIDAYKERGVVAYCEGGGRAGRAIEILEAAGFSNLSVVAGHMKRWRRENRETARSE